MSALHVIYTLAFAISFIEIFIYIYIQQCRRNMKQLMLYILIAISNLGYLSLSLATDVHEAILANKVSYIGSIFIPFFMLLLFFDICKAELNYKISIIISIANTVIMGCVLSIGYSDIYYKSQDIVTVLGVTVLRREYGILHSLRILVLLLEVSYMWYSAFKAYHINKQMSLKTVNSFLGIILIDLVAFIVQMNVLCNALVIIPIAYTISGTAILILNARVEMYDVSINMSKLVDGMEKYGYITFDNNYNYMGSNEFVQSIFTELKTTRVDNRISPKCKMLTHEIVNWVQSWDPDDKESGSKILEVGNFILKCNILRLTHGVYKRPIGYIVEIIDDTKNQEYIKKINEYNNKLEDDLQENINKLENVQNNLLVGLAAIVDSRDNSTGDHVKRTSKCVKVFVKELRKHKDIIGNYDNDFFNAVVKAAPLHDIGKIAIDDAILRKPAKLTDEEFSTMKSHTSEGHKMLCKILVDVDDEGFNNVILNVAKYHHEKWDGTGYFHLKGNEIPFEARIMALADVFDALVSKRYYKKAMSYDEAFNIISDSLGTHFDPVLGQLFIDCRDSLTELYDIIGDR